MSDLDAILRAAPIGVVTAIEDTDDYDCVAETTLDTDVPPPFVYDPWLDQRPFTERQMRMYRLLMPFDHG